MASAFRGRPASKRRVGQIDAYLRQKLGWAQFFFYGKLIYFVALLVLQAISQEGTSEVDDILGDVESELDRSDRLDYVRAYGVSGMASSQGADIDA